jgi:hypothetical protein
VSESAYPDSVTSKILVAPHCVRCNLLISYSGQIRASGGMANKRKDLKIEGSNLWYFVGLITSDGCLSSDGRHIDITSKEYNFLWKVKDVFGLGNKIGIKYNTLKQKNFHIQFSNKNFYDFLLMVGLTPNKSLTLGELNIPRNYFVDFVRGLIDGDGCLRKWVHPTNFGEQCSLRIYSGSKQFLEWLDDKIQEIFKACGKLHKNAKRGTTYVLKFGKMATREIVGKCYYKNCFGLDRKIKLASECFDSYRGWSKSKTVLN